MRGGSLRVISKPVEEATAFFLAEKTGTRPPLGKEDGVLILESAGASSCREDCSGTKSRLCCLYQSRSIFSGTTAFNGRDNFTRYKYFGAMDEADVAPLEYAIYKSWRVQTILNMLADGTVPFSEDKSIIVSVLDGAIAELKQCKESLESVENQFSTPQKRAKWDEATALRAKGVRL
ncbi:hypothetical protein M427DRAFT_69241 [Gonapodya prolifera JEL478]|uniref:Uncharacterized protein n=1 Tax=Gonapodya prolifera (strain JEL478) TaxID=1344416 RepID=A0A139AHF0_GONPJ|nr:hypothetical protein M427DRAFT_69241 [Gonapodya prolifera JEL478]|eukprot:KXS16251.1 hypothetical protein M427DRAFT_69241 [Gonapodya prolifera JEL478]